MLRSSSTRTTYITNTCATNLSPDAIDFFIWRPSDGQNNVETKHVMSITGGGVGIGTTNPLSTLDVSGGGVNIRNGNNFSAFARNQMTVRRCKEH